MVNLTNKNKTAVLATSLCLTGMLLSGGASAAAAFYAHLCLDTSGTSSAISNTSDKTSLVGTVAGANGIPALRYWDNGVTNTSVSCEGGVSVAKWADASYYNFVVGQKATVVVKLKADKLYPVVSGLGFSKNPLPCEATANIEFTMGSISANGTRNFAPAGAGKITLVCSASPGNPSALNPVGTITQK